MRQLNSIPDQVDLYFIYTTLIVKVVDLKILFAVAIQRYFDFASS